MRAKIGMDKIDINNALNLLLKENNLSVMTRAKFSASFRALLPNIQRR